MRRLRHQFVSAHIRHRALWNSAGITMIIALLITGWAFSATTVTQAQPSKPSVSDPGFSPAKPFRRLNRVPPYPTDSLELGEEGVIALRLTVAADGRVTDVKTVRSSGSARLDMSTANWIKSRWRYYPATLNGQPVASTVTFKVTFALRR